MGRNDDALFHLALSHGSSSCVDNEEYLSSIKAQSVSLSDKDNEEITFDTGVNDFELVQVGEVT
jgi:hypothetical protein